MVCLPVRLLTVDRATLSVSVSWFPLVVTEAWLDELVSAGVLAHEGDGLCPSASTAHTALSRLSHPPHKPGNNNLLAVTESFIIIAGQ